MGKNMKHTKLKISQDSLEKEKPQSVAGEIASLGRDTAQSTVDTFKDIGKGIFAELLGQYEKQETQEQQIERMIEAQEEQKEQEKNPKRLDGGTLFSQREVEDQKQVSEIKELLKAIKKEIDEIKKANEAMMAEVADIEKVTFENKEEKQSVYHLFILEVFLNILRGIRMKIGNSSTWMEAMMTKKAKRGSLFASRSKKQGTAYSMSQELSNARSIQ